METTRLPYRALIAILLIALIGRLLLLASNTVSFHSDEAVVALMARHILAGERPVFFYGQAYMGSLDAWLVAFGFRLFGESVLAIRIIQSILYLAIVATAYVAAWRLSGRRVIAAVAALVIALPPVLVALYTTATLGGYNETLLFGNLLLILGYEVTHDHRQSLWRWAALGIAAGLGWWTNGLIIAYALPVGLLIVVDVARGIWNTRSAGGSKPPASEVSRVHGAERSASVTSQSASASASNKLTRGKVKQPASAGLQAFLAAVDLKPAAEIALPLLFALIFFVAGSAPWWAFNLEHDFAPLRFYLVGGERGEFAGTEVLPLPVPQRLIGMIALGLPTVFGLRFPWAAEYFLPVIGAAVLLIYAAAVYRLMRRPSPLKPDARLLIVSMIGLFLALFVVSRFSIDPTGRYFLPLVLPLGIALGALVDSLYRSRRGLALAICGLVIGYHVAGQVTVGAAMTPGFSTQFNLETHIPNDDDDELIAFLEENGLYHGYTNYWISFRLAFLSGERMQYSAALPYKTDLTYTPADDRFPPYREASDAAERIAYITANVEAVKARLEAIFAEQGITYDYARVGVYHVYYNFEPRPPRPPLEF